MQPGDNRRYDNKEQRLIQGPDGRGIQTYEPVPEAGLPTPRLSSPSNPLALPSSTSPIDIKDTGATTVSPRSSLGADSRRTALSSSGRGGSTSYQPLPQAPAFHASEISNATRALGGVTLDDSRSAKGYSDSYVSRPQRAQNDSARSTNVQGQTEVVSHGARIQRHYRAESRAPPDLPGGLGTAPASGPYRQQDTLDQPYLAPYSYHPALSPVGFMASNPISSAAPHHIWQGQTQETLSSQGAGHPFEFSPQTSPFLARPDPASQGVAAHYPQGDPNYQYSSRSGSQNTGNAPLNADLNPVGWSTSTSSPLGTGQSDRTNTSTSHNRRPRKPSAGGGRGRGHSKKSSSVGDETVDPNLSDELIRGTDGKMEPLDPRFQVIFKMLSFEPRGSGRPEGAMNTSVRSFEQEIFAKVYRYVVVKAKHKQYHSVCLRISTNSGRGAAKPGLDQREHAIIYTGSEAPQKLERETRILKEPIRVDPASPEHELHPRSRVNFGMTFPVQHNVKVMAVGMVAPGDLRRFQAYYQNEAEKALVPRY